MAGPGKPGFAPSDWCPRGHHKPRVGKLSHGACAECSRINSRARHYRERGIRRYHRLPRLAEFRRLRGLSEKELANKAGSDPDTVYRLEAGGQAQHGTVIRLCAALEIHPKQLTQHDPDNHDGLQRRGPEPVVGAEPGPNPSGACFCGCGMVTPLSPYTSSRDGTKRGCHVRFVDGHHNRSPEAADLNLSPHL